MEKKPSKGIREFVTRVPIKWRGLLVFAICLFLGALCLTGIYSSPLLERVVLIWLALPISVVVFFSLWSRLQMRRCASCNAPVPKRLSDLSLCPHCERLSGDISSILSSDGVFRLGECLVCTEPTVKLIGMILVMAIHDTVKEIRLVGRQDAKSLPQGLSDRTWGIWLNLKDEAYEMVPPPALIGSHMFLLLQEVHRTAAEMAAPNGPASLVIAIEDYSETVEFVLEDSGDELAARIIFTTEPLKPWDSAKRCLNELLERHCLESTNHTSSDC